MQTETSDGSIERKLVIALIVNSEFLSRIYPRFLALNKDESGLFHSQWSNRIASWCFSYWKKYQKAPQANIESVFTKWAAKNEDKDTERIVERLLSSLSEEYDKEPEELPFLLDMAQDHFNEVRITRLQEKLEQCRKRGKISGALEAVQQFSPVELKSPPYIDILRDVEAQTAAFQSKHRILIEYPGAAGAFFGSEFSEDSFVGIMAPPKGAKSYSLLDIGWRAMMQGRKVAYIQVGDLSQDQIMRRFWKRAAYRPFDTKEYRYPTNLVAPATKKDLAVVDWEKRKKKHPLTLEQGKEAFQRALKKAKGELRLSRHATYTISILEIKTLLQMWEKDGWRADVVVIDYGENLAPVNPRSTPLDQINDTWAYARQLSELLHCCLLMASQTNKEGFKAWCLTRQHFSGNKMKLAHVTAFIGINCTDEEKEEELLRYNFIVRREDEFNETNCLFAASCLAVANPIVLSAV